jgi:N-acetylmuramoyl-L-alanine amidase
MKLVILSGHGGSDPGACNGNYKEADFNLKIATALEKNIKVLTDEIAIIRNRSNDATVSIWGNAALCQRQKPKLSISCHCNASTNSEANGQEVIYWPEDLLGRVLAESICKSNAGLIYNRGAKPDPATPGFVEIKDTGDCVSLIWEVAFISNPGDLKKVINPAWIDKITGNAAKEIIKFYGVKAKPITPPVPPLYNVANEIKYLGTQALNLLSAGKKAELKSFLYAKSNEIINHL